MNSASDTKGSARIYQFPRGGRAALGGRSYGEGQSSPNTSPKSIAQPAAQTGQPTIYSGSWYHDEAIQEAKPAWDR
ncbi:MULTISPECIES: DUF2735 domain-containing protein [unclassified Bradyrhizobium]|uniref:DUF2735 domain-containing protein n=1 Tax=unclassified Bradyrhizobium TaxID=2631580 RepID=UPI0028EEF124|nr:MULTISPECIES: DUF2735 domain-containing protein [unclassified Bradyrhizobium]